MCLDDRNLTYKKIIKNMVYSHVYGYISNRCDDKFVQIDDISLTNDKDFITFRVNVVISEYSMIHRDFYIICGYVNYLGKPHITIVKDTDNKKEYIKGIDNIDIENIKF